MDVQWTAKILVLQYILIKKSPHNLNILPQIPDMTSREYLGDHLKKRLLNANLKQKSTENTKQNLYILFQMG